ncbi:MAG: ABC transporter permease [Chloroflexi bacterium]|nr:ABC transporter permease [Chloroflexota bacterium]
MLNTARINLRLFWDGAVLSYIALFRWLRPSTYIASKVFGPLVYMLFFVLLGRYATGSSDASFFVIGNAIQMCAWSGIYGITMSITGDHWDGTLPYVFGAPANRLIVFLGRAFIHVIDGYLGVVLGFFWGITLLGLDLSQTSLPALALVVLITTISTSGLGMLLGCLSLMTRNVMFVNNTVFFGLLLFAGANVDVATFPGWMQSISYALPLTRGIQAGRAIVAGADLSQVSGLLSTEFLFGLIYIALGYVLFRWFEKQAKRRGTLEAV